MRESQILFELNGHYVASHGGRYEAIRPQVTAAITDSAYTKDRDGLSLAIARVMYMATGKAKAADALALADRIIAGQRPCLIGKRL